MQYEPRANGHMHLHQGSQVYCQLGMVYYVSFDTEYSLFTVFCLTPMCTLCRVDL